MTPQTTETGCCPKFDPAPWDCKVHNWHHKHFIKDHVFTFFYIPLNFGSVVNRMMRKAEKSHANATEWLSLSDHTSQWNMDLYVAMDKEVADAENVKISGKFLSKVYEGDFKDTGKWSKDFADYAKEKGHHVKKTYMWYTTCPKCAKHYGKNYVVIVGEIG